MFAVTLKDPKAPVEKADNGNGNGSGGPPPGVTAAILSIDLETCHAPDDVVRAAVERWQPPANVKDPEKLAERAKDAAERIAERSALLDDAPISVVAIASDQGSWAFSSRPKPVKGRKRGATGWHEDTHYADGEEAMLLALRDVLDRIGTPETLITGWNVLAFDLAKCRSRYVHFRLKLPNILTPRGPREEQDQPCVDLMRRFTRYFSPELHREIMLSLREACDRLGLPDPKRLVSGAQCPDLWADGHTEEVLAYCKVDCAATLSIYHMLSGQGAGVR